MTDRLSVGVIGGGTGTHHARIYNELPSVELVGVSGVDSRQAADTAERCGTTALSRTSLLSIADAVSIVGPTANRYESAQAAIEAGVDLLIETPITEDPAAAKALVTAAENAGVRLHVGHIERFNPVVQTLSKISSELDILALDSQRLGPPTGREIVDSVELDLMIHDADILLSIVESPVASVSAADTANEQYATATVEFENGVVATLTASRVTQQKSRTLSVTAEDCRVSVDYLSQSVQINRHSVPEYVEANGDVRYQRETVIQQPTVKNGEPLKEALVAFVEAAQTGREPIVSAEDGIRALELIKRIQSVAEDR